MSPFAFFVVFGLIFIRIRAQNPTFLEEYLDEFFTLRSRINRFDLEDFKNGDRVKLNRIQTTISNNTSFPCSLENSRSNAIPTNVNFLRPGDIDIIGAIGDSLTAGFAAIAKNIIDMFAENRGMVFTIGGQGTWRNYLTLPNILKEFNPKLFGFSLGISLTRDRNSQFNVAEVGAISSNIPYMAKVLVKRILMDKRTDINNHWKMITIFIGSNDFCNDICFYENPEDSVQIHRNSLIRVLRILRDNLPRTFVNIVLPPDVSVLALFPHVDETCYAMQRIQCPCFVGERFKKSRAYLKTIMEKFRAVDFEIANYQEFDREDFTVVVQPMFHDTVLPDARLLSVDCFHFSQIGHSIVAKGFWNNILEPVGNKSLTFLVEQFKCPTKNNPYLSTKRNSFKSKVV